MFENKMNGNSTDWQQLSYLYCLNYKGSFKIKQRKANQELVSEVKFITERQVKISFFSFHN